MYGQFIRDMPETTARGKTCKWLRSSDLEVQTGGRYRPLICTAQGQVLRTTQVKHDMYKTIYSTCADYVAFIWKL